MSSPVYILYSFVSFDLGRDVIVIQKTQPDNRTLSAITSQHNKQPEERLRFYVELERRLTYYPNNRVYGLLGQVNTLLIRSAFRV